MTDLNSLKSDLTVHWFITSMMFTMLIAFNIICHSLDTDIQINLDEKQRVLIRTILYVLTIIIFPVVNLLRYILLRLNQTMPGDNPAKNRYLVTVGVSQVAIEMISVFGFIMFILGDYYNTLYIFSTLGALGIFLHRPKIEEYQQILQALQEKN